MAKKSLLGKIAEATGLSKSKDSDADALAAQVQSPIVGESKLKDVGKVIDNIRLAEEASNKLTGVAKLRANLHAKQARAKAAQQPKI